MNTAVANTNSLSLTVERIGPHVAARMLENNTSNRPLSRTNVERLKGAILRGEWQVNNDAITIDANGNLTNGQHRLTAICDTGVAVDIPVIRGVAPSSFQVTDVFGKSRSVADVLAIAGYKDPILTASMARVLLSFYSTGTFRFQGSGASTDIFSGPRALEFLEANPQVSANVAIARRYAGHLGRMMVPRMIGALLTLFADVDEGRAFEFFDIIGGIESDAPDSPAVALRDRLIKSIQSAQHQLNAESQTAMAIKAWNAFIKGDTLPATLTYRRFGKHRESMPQIFGYEYGDEGARLDVL